MTPKIFETLLFLKNDQLFLDGRLISEVIEKPKTEKF